MKFYFSLGSAQSLPAVETIIERMLGVGGEEQQSALADIKGVLKSAMNAGYVDKSNHHQVVALFALIMLSSTDDQNGERQLSLSDDEGQPIAFHRDDEWRNYLDAQGVIAVDRKEEAEEIFVAYGAMQPIMDLSMLGLASTDSESEFCF